MGDNQVLAAMTGFSLTLIVTLANGRSVGEFVVLMSAGTASIVLLNQVANLRGNRQRRHHNVEGQQRED